MKLKTNILILFTLVLCSCNSSYVQIFETNSKSGLIKNETNYVYENDSVKITYSFWEDKGKMSFLVYNKLKKPLYIDWKKSSYISNTIKINYWDDVTTTNSVEMRQTFGVGYNLSSIRKYYISNSVGVSSSASSKPERITFIPPNSNYYRTQFNLLPIRELKIKDYQSIQKQSITNKSKTVKVFEKSITKDDSPLIFRNFITLSYNENFTNEFYVDNEFYVSKVIKLNSNQFENIARKENSSFGQRDENGRLIKISPYRDEKSFYLRIKQ